VIDWDDEGETEFTLEQTEHGTKLHVRESTPHFSTALALRALAFAHA
jgi:hypothetical protein